MTASKPSGPLSPGSTASSLLERARAHDPEAWRKLVDLYGPLVYHWCRQQRLAPEDVADVFQEVFRSVASSLATFRKDKPGATFRGWLLTITRNKIRDLYRRQQGKPRAAGGSDAREKLEQLPGPDESSDSALQPAPDAGVLHRALEMIKGEFSEPTWQAFWRTTVDGESPADVAAALKITVNAVYKAKARVLRRLREECGELLD